MMQPYDEELGGALQVNGDIVVLNGKVIQDGGSNSGVVLFENENGTNGNITLTDTAENYTSIEIAGYRTVGDYSVSFVEKIDEPNGKRIGLKTFAYHSSAVPLTIGIFTINVNNKTLSKVNASSFNVSDSGSISVTSTNLTSIYITKVTGYNETNYENGDRREY